MRRHIHSARDLVLPVIDFFYPPFKKFMGLQTFRYAASGSINTALGFVIFYIGFKFIFRERPVDLSFYVFEAHSAALLLSFCICFPFGFFLMKYVVFSDSKMKGRIQLFRYLMLYVFNLGLNYILLRLFVETLKIYPTFAQVITTALIVLFSYVAQRNFTFRIRNAEDEITG
ncbi:MAG: GtrA family protein [Ferruginibacter sp.]|nr:GtrA family protein [Chitinophagaceae bacterium]